MLTQNKIKKIDMAINTLDMFERAFEIFLTEEKDITPYYRNGNE
jgi:hypothetical protein